MDEFKVGDIVEIISFKKVGKLYSPYFETDIKGNIESFWYVLFDDGWVTRFPLTELRKIADAKEEPEKIPDEEIVQMRKPTEEEIKKFQEMDDAAALAFAATQETLLDRFAMAALNANINAQSIYYFQSGGRNLYDTREQLIAYSYDDAELMMQEKLKRESK